MTAASPFHDPWAAAPPTAIEPAPALPGEPAPVSIDGEPLAEDFLSKVNRYARLRREQEAREIQAEAIKDEANKLEAELLEDFSAAAVQNVKTSDGTVYFNRLLWAKVEEGSTKDDVITGLIAAGHPEFVTRGYNSQTVSGWLREREKAGEKTIPPELDGVLTTSEVFRLKVRKS